METAIDYMSYVQIQTAQKLELFRKLAGYSLSLRNNQRVLRPVGDSTFADRSAEHGSELFVTRIPKDAFEDELLPFLSAAGRVQKLRLMTTPSQLHTKGYAFVTYSSRDDATRARCLLESMAFRGRILTVEHSKDNCRLFIGGVPERKSKDEVWQALSRIGMTCIVDVIMYRSYCDRKKNRGFVFVEFGTHQEAAEARTRFRNLRLWGDCMHIDWSTPIPDVEANVMMKVKKLFLRNLNVTMMKHELESFLLELLGPHAVTEKVYKFKDYAFVHFKTRREAQHAMALLQDYFKRSDVEVCWAIPQMYANNQKKSNPMRSNALPIQHVDAYDPNYAECNDAITHSNNNLTLSSNLDVGLHQFPAWPSQRMDAFDPYSSLAQNSNYDYVATINYDVIESFGFARRTQERPIPSDEEILEKMGKIVDFLYSEG